MLWCETTNYHDYFAFLGAIIVLVFLHQSVTKSRLGSSPRAAITFSLILLMEDLIVSGLMVFSCVSATCFKALVLGISLMYQL